MSERDDGLLTQRDWLYAFYRACGCPQAPTGDVARDSRWLCDYLTATHGLLAALAEELERSVLAFQAVRQAREQARGAKLAVAPRRSRPDRWTWE